MANRPRDLYYYEGSTVRKIEAEPDWSEQPEVVRRKKVVTYPKAARQAERSLSFDARYTFMLVTMLIIVIASCIAMLTIQSKVEAKQSKIRHMQEELQTIEADNAAYQNKLDNMYSLDDIYQIATNELGMVYSQNGQVVYYESESGDYVKQYKDIPGSK